MALVPTTMQGIMLDRADPLINLPPLNALGRIYLALAEGCIDTLTDPASCLVEVSWTGLTGTGTGSGGPGCTGMNADAYGAAAKVAALHTGIASDAFYKGVGGIVQYMLESAEFSEAACPVGAPGTGSVLSVFFDADACYDNIVAALPPDMKVQHPDGVKEPTPGKVNIVPQGDILLQMDQLITAVSTELESELQNLQVTLTVAGAGSPPPSAGITFTTRIV